MTEEVLGSLRWEDAGGVQDVQTPILALAAAGGRGHVGDRKVPKKLTEAPMVSHAQQRESQHTPSQRASLKIPGGPQCRQDRTWRV